jgi:broad specificity phosphatase PhoE
MAVAIIYETHQISTDNEVGIATGWLPGRLSTAGRELARELGERRRHDGFAAIFSSDLRRAVETVELAFGGQGIAMFQDARLRECKYGELNGMPVERLAEERPRRVTIPYPGGQSYQDVVAATDDFLRDLAAQWDGTTVLIIAHSANKWALDVLLNGASLEELVNAHFAWQAGWRYTLPTGWTGAHSDQGTAFSGSGHKAR